MRAENRSGGITLGLHQEGKASLGDGSSRGGGEKDGGRKGERTRETENPPSGTSDRKAQKLR